MKKVILFSISLFILSCGSTNNVEEITVRGKKAYILKESANSNDVLIHFKTKSGEYVAAMGKKTGGAGYDVSNCNYCYIECFFAPDQESCDQDCDVSEDCKGLVPTVKIVKSVSSENLNLFNAQQ